MNLAALQKQDVAPGDRTAVLHVKRPVMLWVGAVMLFLCMAWEIVPSSILVVMALKDDEVLTLFWNPYGTLIVVWVLLRTILCLVMMFGLLKQAAWAWKGVLLTVHGIYVPSLVVLLSLYMLNLITPPVRIPDLRDIVTDYLVRIIIPYGLTYVFLLFCLTRKSVKTALGATE